MADDYDEALSDSEASALSHAYALLRKMTHVLEPVGRHANDLWPGPRGRLRLRTFARPLAATSPSIGG
jgi:hypothetical protein